MEHLSNPRIWLAAAVIAVLMSATPVLLDGPDELVVMQLIADDKAAAETTPIKP